MREKLSRQLPVFLNESGVLQSKGLELGAYQITFQFSKCVHVNRAGMEIVVFGFVYCYTG